MNEYIKNTIDLFKNFFESEMDEMEKHGYIISKEIVLEIFQKMRENIK